MYKGIDIYTTPKAHMKKVKTKEVFVNSYVDSHIALDLSKSGWGSNSVKKGKMLIFLINVEATFLLLVANP